MTGGGHTGMLLEVRTGLENSMFVLLTEDLTRWTEYNSILMSDRLRKQITLSLGDAPSAPGIQLTNISMQ